MGSSTGNTSPSCILLLTIRRGGKDSTTSVPLSKSQLDIVKRLLDSTDRLTTSLAVSPLEVSTRWSLSDYTER